MFQITFGIGKTHVTQTASFDTARLIVDALVKLSWANVKINGEPALRFLADNAPQHTVNRGAW